MRIDCTRYPNNRGTIAKGLSLHTRDTWKICNKISSRDTSLSKELDRKIYEASRFTVNYGFGFDEFQANWRFAEAQ